MVGEVLRLTVYAQPLATSVSAVRKATAIPAAVAALSGDRSSSGSEENKSSSAVSVAAFRGSPRFSLYRLVVTQH